MLKPEAVAIFLRVAELGGFTRAADSLGLPKASVSNAVQRLEASLGTRLLHRTTRKVQLTQDGQLFYDRSRDLLAELDELESLFQHEGPRIGGRLRVDMPNGLARNLVVPRLPEFLAAYPRLEIELSSTDRRVDLIEEGFDCVVRVGSLHDARLVARPLGRLRLVNCASPDYLARFGTPRRLDDLAGHRLVHYVQALGSRPGGWEYVEDGEEREIPLGGVVTVNNADAYQAACLAGLGIIQTPEIGVRELLAAGRLVEVLPRYQAAPMPVTLLYAERRHLSKRVRLFMDWLGEALRPHLVG